MAEFVPGRHSGFFAMASGTSKLDAAAAAPPASRSRRGCSTIVGARRRALAAQLMSNAVFMVVL